MPATTCKTSCVVDVFIGKDVGTGRWRERSRNMSSVHSRYLTIIYQFFTGPWKSWISALKSLKVVEIWVSWNVLTKFSACHQLACLVFRSYGIKFWLVLQPGLELHPDPARKAYDTPRPLSCCRKVLEKSFLKSFKTFLKLKVHEFKVTGEWQPLYIMTDIIGTLSLWPHQRAVSGMGECWTTVAAWQLNNHWRDSDTQLWTRQTVTAVWQSPGVSK